MLKYYLSDRIFVSYVYPILLLSFGIITLILEKILNIKVTARNEKKSDNGIPVQLAWFIKTTPCVLVPSYLLYYYWSSTQMTNILVAMYFLIHYIHRVIFYSWSIRGEKKESLGHIIFVFIFCFLYSYSITKNVLIYEIYPKNDYLTLRFILGTILFFTGYFINLQSDTILRNLRKDNNTQEYKIPRGGLFEYVSGANFFGESIEWTGFAICACTLPAIVWSINTWINIGFCRAINHHQYYLEKFKDQYPKNRKAIIPFIL